MIITSPITRSIFAQLHEDFRFYANAFSPHTLLHNTYLQYQSWQFAFSLSPNYSNHRTAFENDTIGFVDEQLVWTVECLKSHSSKDIHFEIVLGSKACLNNRLDYDIDHYTFADEIIAFKFSYYHVPEPLIYLAYQFVNDDYRRQGIMKLMSLNLLRQLYTKYGDIKVESMAQHIATWKFYHRHEELTPKYDVFTGNLKRPVNCSGNISHLLRLHHY